jgi:hypothetical protein
VIDFFKATREQHTNPTNATPVNGQCGLLALDGAGDEGLHDHDSHISRILTLGMDWILLKQNVLRGEHRADEDRPKKTAAIVLGGGLKRIEVRGQFRYEPEEQAKARLDKALQRFMETEHQRMFSGIVPPKRG